jgi:lysozyme
MSTFRTEPRRLGTGVASLLLVATALAGCGGAGGPEESPVEPAPTRDTTSPTPAPASSDVPTASASPRQRPERGVDVSHHQGEIDWARVHADGIGFAYLKASEGSGFVDPRFETNARAARRAGLRVGGYHYFTLCSPGAPQAEHFGDVLDAASLLETRVRSMPPAIDLELLGNCADPPARGDLLREVRAFIDVVERRTGQHVVVYAYPDFESRYRISNALDRRLWVRRIGRTPPAGDWWMWQRNDHATIDGITGPADLNVLAP